VRRSYLLAVLLVGCGTPSAPKEAAAEEPAPVAVQIASAQRRDVQDTLSVDGSLVLPEGATSKLAPTVAGKLVEVSVKEGDRVSAGQLLARVDTRALVAQSQSAQAGAASASATAIQSDLALKAAQSDQGAAVRAARLALDVAVASGKASVEQAAVELQRLRAGARPQEVAQAQLAVDQARITRNKAKSDADRDQRLLAEGLVAGSQADASQAALQTAESALASAQAALDLVREGARPEEIRASELRLSAARSLAAKQNAQARAALTQAEAGRLGVLAKAQEAVATRLAAGQKAADARAAAASISSGEIRSPISGYVIRRFLNPGDTADATTPVLAVSSIRPTADFIGNVSPDDARKIHEGMPVLVGDFSGRVSSVGEADPATGLVPVRAHLAGGVRAGGFATARIVLSTLKGTTVVPSGAVLSREGKDSVFVVQNGVAHLKDVQLGPEQGGQTAIRSGISPGSQVVVLGGHELSDGAKVEAAKEP